MTLKAAENNNSSTKEKTKNKITSETKKGTTQIKRNTNTSIIKITENITKRKNSKQENTIKSRSKWVKCTKISKYIKIHVKMTFIIIANN